MATITCPHCKGTGVNYVIVPGAARPSMEQVTCAVCDGKGAIPDPTPPPPPADKPMVADTEPELWPILVPLGIFTLFFVFLAL